MICRESVRGSTRGLRASDQQLNLRAMTSQLATPSALSDLPGGLTEVYLDQLIENQNEVFREQLRPEFSYLAMSQASDKEWSQVFDLEDAALVCVVKANQLEMRLVHLTKGPLSELSSLVAGESSARGSARHAPFASAFMKSEAEVESDLEDTFRRFEKAKLTFDAPIVQNLELRPNRAPTEEVREISRLQGLKTPEQMQYRISLATRANHIYYVYFDRYYLQRGQTVFVEKSDTEMLGYLGQRQLMCFDMTTDFENDRDLFVVGSSQYVAPETSFQDANQRQAAVKAAIDGSLTFLSGSREVLTLQGRVEAINAANQPAAGGSWFSRLSENISKISARVGTGSQQAAPQQSNELKSKFSQRLASALAQPDTNSKNLEGVVALKALTNNLLAVLYTTGLLRIIQVSSTKILVESELLRDDGKGEALDKAVEAQIAFKTHLTISERTFSSKSISLFVNMKAESCKSATKQTVLQTLCLRFADVDVDPTQQGDPAAEETFSLGRTVELIHLRQQVLLPGTSVSSVAHVDDGTFLYTTFDHATKENSIFSTSFAQPIWDRGSQEMNHHLADSVPFTREQMNQCPQLAAPLRKHYFDRITVPGRFAPVTIQSALEDEGFFDANFSLKENLKRAIERSQVSNIQRFLKNLIKIEEDNSRILAMSAPLRANGGWRIIVRPLGISFVAQTSYLSAVEAEINLGSVEKEAYISITDTEELIDFLGLLKTSIRDSLTMFDQYVLDRPSQIRRAALECLRKAKNEEAVQKMTAMLQEQAPLLSRQLQKFMATVIDKLVLAQASKGTAAPAQRNAMKETQAADRRLSDAALKVMERLILAEVTCLYQILVEVYFGQIMLQTKSFAVDEKQLQKVEFWISQIAALRRVFAADFVMTKDAPDFAKLRTGERTARFEIARHGTVLAQLLKDGRRRPEILQVLSEEADQQSTSDLLIKMIRVYTMSDKLSAAAEAPTCVSVLLKQLADLGQYEQVLSYCRASPVRSLTLLYAKLLAITHLGEQGHLKEDFLVTASQLVQECLVLPKAAQNKVTLRNFFLTKQSALVEESTISLINEMERETDDVRIKALLTCATELATPLVLDQGGPPAEKFAALFIRLVLKTATRMPLMASLSKMERDYLLGLLFDSQRSGLTYDIMHWAALNIKDISTRQTYLLKFFEIVRHPAKPENVRSCIYTYCLLGQPDVTLLVEAIQERILLKLNAAKEVFTLRWREEACQLLLLYRDVANLYNWQDQLVRFAWFLWKTQVTVQLARQAIGAKKQPVENLLEFAVQLISIAEEACASCGEAFYFHWSQETVSADQAAVRSRGVKRTFQQSFGRQEPDAKPSSANEQSDQIWKALDRLKLEPDHLAKGILTRVDAHELNKTLLLLKAKLSCLADFPKVANSSNPSEIAKFLAELGHHALAIQLMKAHKLSPAFAIVTHLESILDDGKAGGSATLDDNDGDADGLDEEGKKDAEAEALKRKKEAAAQLDEYLRDLDSQFLAELAQCLLALKIAFTDEMRKAVISKGIISFVVSCCLTADACAVLEAIKILTASRDAVTVLVETNLGLAVPLKKAATDELARCAERKRKVQELLQSMQAAVGGLGSSMAMPPSGFQFGGGSGLHGPSSGRVAQGADDSALVFESGKKYKRILDEIEAEQRTIKEGMASIERTLREVLKAKQQ